MTQNCTTQKDILSVAEAAEYLGLSESIIRRLIKERKIPYNKIERRYLFYLPIIREWLMKNTFQSECTAIENNDDQIEKSVNQIWKRING